MASGYTWCTSKEGAGKINLKRSLCDREHRLSKIIMGMKDQAFLANKTGLRECESQHLSLMSICLPEQGLESLSEREPDDIAQVTPKTSDISHHGIIKTVFAMHLHLKRVVSTWRTGAAQVNAGIGISLH